MPEEKIILNDGTEYNGSLMESSGTLWLFLEPGQMASYFDKLNDPVNTIRITHINWGTATVYAGYNHLYWIKEEPNKNITAGFVKV